MQASLQRHIAPEISQRARVAIHRESDVDARESIPPAPNPTSTRDALRDARSPQAPHPARPETAPSSAGVQPSAAAPSPAWSPVYRSAAKPIALFRLHQQQRPPHLFG